MAGRRGPFWVGVVVGFIVMVLLGSLPVLGPLIGGFISGLIAKGGARGGAMAGFVAGLFGVIVISIILIIGGSLLFGIPGFLTGLGISFIVVLAAFYFGLLGTVGGALAGVIVG
jgi:hypothetical protein